VSEPLPRAPSFRDALRFWSLLGWIGFGGPAGQIAIMHAELVERRRWFAERQFLDGASVCMLLPGPEAQQLATWIGWRLHGVRGGLAAGALFVLPSILLMWLLSVLYVRYGALPQAAGVLDGLNAAVLALLAHALWRLARRMLRGTLAFVLAPAAGLAVGVSGVPFPLVVAVAAACGVLVAKAAAGPVTDAGDCEEGARRRARRAALACVFAWLLPVALALAAFGPQSTLARAGLFFSEAALVTFGGAYAVLPYVAQRAVEDYAWLGTAQMMAGLGLAETTPGPLIMVVQFVGFVAGWQHPDAGLAPLAAATGVALLTTWVTFLPSFAFVFAGAPYVSRLARNARWRGALDAIGAAVIGVIANLAIVFAAHALLASGRVRYELAALALLLFFALARNLPLPFVVVAGVLGGVALRAIGA
jgi:chromate transporter